MQHVTVSRLQGGVVNKCARPTEDLSALNAASITQLEQHVLTLPAACRYMINADGIIIHGIQQAQPAYAAYDIDGAPASAIWMSD